MKNNKITFSLIASLVLLFTAINPAYSQAYHKGVFIINLSEGSTGGTYSTYSNGEHTNPIGYGHEGGTRDPIALEYGISKHFGIGLSSGTDFYYVNAQKYYGFGLPTDQVKATTSEFTIDGSYHFIVTPHMDFAAVLSLGGSSVFFSGGSGDQSYKYTSKGGIERLGLHGRFYIGNHFGFLVMASMFSMTNSTNGINNNTVGNGITTKICGSALEFGFCYRIRK